jgi:DNA mismatch repair ATPase MutL
MQVLRLNEQQLHALIQESVRSALKEISMNTVDSAIDKSDEKMKDSDPRSAQGRKDREQNDNLKFLRAQRFGYDPKNSSDRFCGENQRKQARWEKNNEDRRNGKLNYKDGKWKHND